MEINVSGRRIEMNATIREYAEKKASKLSRFYDRITSIDVVADRSNNTSPEVELEIIVHVAKSDPFVVKVTKHDLYACIDDAIDKLERQLAKHKDKVRNFKHSSSRSDENKSQQ